MNYNSTWDNLQNISLVRLTQERLNRTLIGIDKYNAGVSTITNQLK